MRPVFYVTGKIYVYGPVLRDMMLDFGFMQRKGLTWIKVTLIRKILVKAFHAKFHINLLSGLGYK
jgi:hypothetical protein